MKNILWLLPFLFVGVAAGQCDKGCQWKEPVSKVTQLTQCEKDKLRAAQAKLESVKEEILVAHGKPVQATTMWPNAWQTVCPFVYSYESYDILNDMVVEIKHTETYQCGSVISAQ